MRLGLGLNNRLLSKPPGAVLALTAGYGVRLIAKNGEMVWTQNIADVSIVDSADPTNRCMRWYNNASLVVRADGETNGDLRQDLLMHTTAYYGRFPTVDGRKTVWFEPTDFTNGRFGFNGGTQACSAFTTHVVAKIHVSPAGAAQIYLNPSVICDDGQNIGLHYFDGKIVFYCYDGTTLQHRDYTDAGGWHLITIVGDGNNTRLRVDGAAVGAVMNQCARATVNAWPMGGTSQTLAEAHPPDHYLSELVNYGSALTAGQILANEAYLKSVWNTP